MTITAHQVEAAAADYPEVATVCRVLNVSQNEWAAALESDAEIQPAFARGYTRYVDTLMERIRNGATRAAVDLLLPADRKRALILREEVRRPKRIKRKIPL